MKTVTFIFISTLIMLGSIINTSYATSGNDLIAFLDSLAADAGVADSIEFDSLPMSDQEKEVVKRGDTTYVSFGNKKIQIIEKDGQTDVKIKDKTSDEDNFTFEDDGDDRKESKRDKEDTKSGKKFKGHWSGFEFGLNNFVDQDYSFSRSDESSFLDINTGKSWNFNWNIFQYSLGFGTDRVGLVTGLGLEWSNYHFKDTTSIYENNANVAPYIFSDNIEPDNIIKNRLQTTYLTVPLILESQFLGKGRNKRLYAGVGVIGGIKLFSNTKIKYVENGIDQKVKNKQDFYLSPLRLGVTARVGYRALKLYANYYVTPLFIEGKGPEQLNPVAAGLVVSF